jgi:hypothetical protein
MFYGCFCAAPLHATFCRRPVTWNVAMLAGCGKEIIEKEPCEPNVMFSAVEASVVFV